MDGDGNFFISHDIISEEPESQPVNGTWVLGRRGSGVRILFRVLDARRNC